MSEDPSRAPVQKFKNVAIGNLLPLDDQPTFIKNNVNVDDTFQFSSPTLITNKISGFQTEKEIEIGNCNVNTIKVDNIKSNTNSSVTMNNVIVDTLNTDTINGKDLNKAVNISKVQTNGIQFGTVLEIESTGNMKVKEGNSLTYNGNAVATKPDIQESLQGYKKTQIYKKEYKNPQKEIKFLLTETDLKKYSNVLVNLDSSDDAYMGVLTLSFTNNNKVFISNELDYGTYSHSVNLDSQGYLVYTLSNNENPKYSSLKVYSPIKTNAPISEKADRTITLYFS